VRVSDWSSVELDDEDRFIIADKEEEVCNLLCTDESLECATKCKEDDRHCMSKCVENLVDAYYTFGDDTSGSTIAGVAGNFIIFNIL
jgi:hypothetical protein